jgi:branched-chain amino acid transport system permease protein
MSGLSYFLQQLVNGLALGSIYALVAIGLSMVYGILHLINFAHGDVMTVGCFVALVFAWGTGYPFWLVLLIPPLVCAVFGLLMERATYRPLRKAPEVALLITSLGISILIQNFGILFFTAQPRSFRAHPFLKKLHIVHDVLFSNFTIVIVVLTLLIMFVLNLIVKKTKIGMAMRATAENLNIAKLMGININHVIVFCFVVGSYLAAIAGVLWAGQFGKVDPLMGFVPGLKAFVAAVIGGIGSIPGAMLGGYILGFAEIFLVGFLPATMTPYRDAFVFLILILVLLLRPAGILGKAQIRKV